MPLFLSFQDSLKRTVGFLSILIVFFLAGCSQHSADQPAKQEKPSVTKTGKGKTGVFDYYRDGYLYARTSYKNGKKDGPTKRFYPDGTLYSVVYYKNDIRVDTSRSYYSNGKLFRETPYNNGKVDGIQRKFYKDGSLWAEIPHKNGKRKLGLKEMTKSGWPVTYYPDILIKATDLRSIKGYYELTLSLSNSDRKVQFYLGTLKDGVFDKSACKTIPADNGTASLRFIQKETEAGVNTISIIALYTTPLLDKKILTLKYKIPFPHLIMIKTGI